MIIPFVQCAINKCFSSGQKVVAISVKIFHRIYFRNKRIEVKFKEWELCFRWNSNLTPILFDEYTIGVLKIVRGWVSRAKKLDVCPCAGLVGFELMQPILVQTGVPFIKSHRITFNNKEARNDGKHITKCSRMTI